MRQDDTPARVKKNYLAHKREERRNFAVFPTMRAEESLEDHEENDHNVEPGVLEARRLKVLFDILEIQENDPVLGLSHVTTFASLGSFVADANATSKRFKDANPEFKDLLIFKETPYTTQPAHITDTQAKPDIVAAFEPYWFDGRGKAAEKSEPVRNHVPWPCISLAGEDASKGESKDEQGRHAASYLDLLLLSRSDFRGAFGLLISKTRVLLLFAIGGVIIVEFSFGWKSACVSRAMAAMIYRLYDPGPWRDPTIQMVYDGVNHSCTYDIAFKDWTAWNEPDGLTGVDEEDGVGTGTTGASEMDEGSKPTGGRVDEGTDSEDDGAGEDSQPKPKEGMRFSGFVCRYASGSFGTRTHIFVYNGAKPAPEVAGRPLRVVKNQLVRENTRFDEIDLLKAIHTAKIIPGVVRLVCYEMAPPWLIGRKQIRLGLEQRGQPFMSIKTAREMLMAAYDALEISRILHRERNVLHRDMSTGNILVVPRAPNSDQQQSDGPPPAATLLKESAPLDFAPGNSQLSVSATAPQERSVRDSAGDEDSKRVYAFVAHLLGLCDDRGETQTLLIDFNRSDYTAKERARPSEEVFERTGTPMFMARGIETKGPLSLRRNRNHTIEVLEPHDIYKRTFPERCNRFRDCEVPFYFRTDDEGKPPHPISGMWRHQLHHDAESIYWIIFYWILLATPSTRDMDEGRAAWKVDEGIPSCVWESLATAESRESLIFRPHESTFHPSYAKLFPLVEDLSRHLECDPHWFPTDNPRSDPEYVHECFQRIIFNFLKREWDESFMTLEKSNINRHVRPSLSTA